MCPVFIGRVSERDALFRLLDRTRSGQGSVALVCGEAGIGKSRLIAEAKAEASALGFLLLQGSCFQVDSSYPYAPLLDLLRVSAVPTPDAPDPIVLEFARLLPELASDLSGPLPTPQPDPEQEKRRLFAALTRFFKERASQRPVLLVIEDLHWCDDVSLEFLQSLARSCAMQPLLLLMTYRSDEVQPSLQRCLAQLDRSRLSQELQLMPLSRSDVDAMLDAMFALQISERANRWISSTRSPRATRSSLRRSSPPWSHVEYCGLMTGSGSASCIQIIAANTCRFHAACRMPCNSGRTS
jgi:predicted ATPase